MTSAPALFEFMRKRHEIFLARKAGKKWPWTDDPILRGYSFTNVYRELDKTTVWFRENIRSKLENPVDIVFATILFRWFNRIETGQALIDAAPSNDPRRYFLTSGYDRRKLDSIIRPLPKWITGAYIIKTPDGMDKLNGVLWCVDNFLKQANSIHYPDESKGKGLTVVEHLTLDMMGLFKGEKSLERAHTLLKQMPFLGDFMAYEIVTDLRHTKVLQDAPDIMTWANPGPGAMRGINRIEGWDLKKRQNRVGYINIMKHYLALSKIPAAKNIGGRGSISMHSRYWPNNEDFPPLEMRDIEHSLCEFDKYERVRLGEGRPRNKYKV